MPSLAVSALVFFASVFAQALPTELVLKGRIKWKQRSDQTVVMQLTQKEVSRNNTKYVGTVKTVSQNRSSEQKVNVWFQNRSGSKVVLLGSSQGAVFLRFQSNAFSANDLATKLIPVRVRLEALKDCFGAPVECIPVVEVIDQGVMWVQSER